jgi:hypothetical protein
LFEQAVRGGCGLRELMARRFFLGGLFRFAISGVFISHGSSLPQVGGRSQVILNLGSLKSGPVAAPGSCGTMAAKKKALKPDMNQIAFRILGRSRP